MSGDTDRSPWGFTYICNHLYVFSRLERVYVVLHGSWLVLWVPWNLYAVKNK